MGLEDMKRVVEADSNGTNFASSLKQFDSRTGELLAFDVFDEHSEERSIILGYKNPRDSLMLSKLEKPPVAGYVEGRIDLSYSPQGTMPSPNDKGEEWLFVPGGNLALKLNEPKNLDSGRHLYNNHLNIESLYDLRPNFEVIGGRGEQFSISRAYAGKENVVKGLMNDVKMPAENPLRGMEYYGALIHFSGVEDFSRKGLHVSTIDERFYELLDSFNRANED